MTNLDPSVLSQLPPLSEVRKEISRRAALKAQEIAARSGRMNLSDFIPLAWHALEPGRDYVHGWHIDAISEHLEAIGTGEIKRLAIALPPGMMKSMLIAVLYPAWLWGPHGQAFKRIIGFSHRIDLSMRDATRCRNLMTSEWYKGLWGTQFKLRDDQNTKTRYENDQTGFRISDYVRGGTGDRGDLLLIDDPHQVMGADSDTIRGTAITWLHEAMPTRLTDPKKSAIVVIHHRLHEQDMIGEILASDLGYEYLMLPMEFERDRRCTTSIGFKDPRTKEGELLFPERFPKEVVERDKRAMGSYAVAGQFQQRPAPRGGGMFKRHWFEIVASAPSDCRWVRHWDLAATEGAGAYTAGVLLGHSKSTGKYYVGDVIRQQLSGDQVKKLIRQTAILDEADFGRRNYSIHLPQDPGQAGKVQAKDFVTMLAGFDVHAEIESGEKEVRARPFAAQAEAENVKLIRGDWNDAYLHELSSFPTGKNKDQVDASSGAFGALLMKPAKAQLRIATVRGLV